MIRVLVVDDDPLAAEAHAAYAARVDGFEVGAIARTAAEAHAALTGGRHGRFQLVLLDITLPDATGLDLARRLRAERSDVDIMAITAVRDLETVQAAMAVGAVSYLIKPFGFAALRDRLLQYAAFRERIAGSGAAASQDQVDALLAALRPASAVPLPKGLSAPTLEAVAAVLRAADAPLSASETAERVRTSRVTARRYLEHLADLGVARRSPRYGAPGRPETAYDWVASR